MLKLKLQYSGHLMQRGDLLEKTLTLGKIEVRKKSGQQRIRWLVGTTNSVNMNLRKLLELAQTHIHQVSDGIQPSHPLSSPSPPAFNLSQHQCLF